MKNYIILKASYFKAIAICFLFFFLSNCWTPTQYIQKGKFDNNGYSEKKIEEQLYKIKVIGNTSTDKKRIIDIFLLRCATLAQEGDYPFFLLSSESIDLDLEDLDDPEKRILKQYNLKRYQFGLEKFEITGYVLLLTVDEARKARQARKPLRWTKTVYNEKSYLFKELNEFLKKQEEKEKEKTPKKNKRKKELKKIDEELGLIKEESTNSQPTQESTTNY